MSATGQKRKSCSRAYVFRFAKNGHLGLQSVSAGVSLGPAPQIALQVTRYNILRRSDRCHDPSALEKVIEAIAEAGAAGIAAVLWDRYCDFEKVYRACLPEPAQTATLRRRGSSRPARLSAN
jgi:hypothetical protein